MPAEDVPEHLRPFDFHGLVFHGRGKDGTADCPFCGRAGKMGINLETTQWRCYACNVGKEGGKEFAGGNSLTFIRLLWEHSLAATSDASYEELRTDRGFSSIKTLKAWGLARSITTGEWLAPQFTTDGRLHQLCRRVRIPKVKDGKRTFVSTFLPTPGLHESRNSLALFMSVTGIKSDRPDLIITEGVWDGMAIWEVMHATKAAEDGTLSGTANAAASLAASTNFVSVPGVGVWRESWTDLAGGKNVCLMYDNDHPREHPPGSGTFTQAGLDGVRRVTGLLLTAPKPPASISWVKWGDEGDGWHKELKDGHDLRDSLCSPGATAADRRAAFASLRDLIRPVPDAWLKDAPAPGEKAGGTSLRPLPCHDWKELITQWRKAMAWRQGLEDVLSVMLSVALSTEQTGDQLFLQVIGEPSSGKTQFCDGMLVSHKCHALEHLTGFHSGWKGGKAEKGKDGKEEDKTGKDFSLLARINRKTLITAEGDVVMSAPSAGELMSQQRRIFDGKSGATFKNSDEDRVYDGLRTPWIMAGTQALLDNDQARLGDRFLRVMMDLPDADARQAIMRRVGFTALRSVLVTSSGEANGQRDGASARAYRMTGGYVDHLRDNPARLLARVKIEDEEHVVDRCGELAQFAADLRARFNPDPKKDAEAVKEMPFRLQHQFVRLAACLAVVTGRFVVDDEVLRVVRKVAVDTAHGWSLKIVGILHAAGEAGESAPRLAVRVGLSEDKLKSWLRFLCSKKIDVVEAVEIAGGPAGLRRVRWRLTPRMTELCAAVLPPVEPEDVTPMASLADD